jgi:hypothetical protein
MTVISPSDFNPRFNLSRRAALVLLAVFLGLLSFTAVRSLNADCANEYLTGDDGITRLMSDDEQFLVTGRVWLRLGEIRVLLPEGVQPILAKLGLMPTECR